MVLSPKIPRDIVYMARRIIHAQPQGLHCRRHPKQIFSSQSAAGRRVRQSSGRQRTGPAAGSTEEPKSRLQNCFLSPESTRSLSPKISKRKVLVSAVITAETEMGRALFYFRARAFKKCPRRLCWIFSGALRYCHFRRLYVRNCTQSGPRYSAPDR